jgi:hypothetical protein
VETHHVRYVEAPPFKPQKFEVRYVSRGEIEALERPRKPKGTKPKGDRK